MTRELKSHRIAARLFGLFFILAFMSYGVGSGMVASVADSPDGIAGYIDHRTTLIVGVILMAIVHSFVNIGLSVLAFPVLNSVNGFLARGYFAAGIAATVTAVVGALFLALLVPLGEAFVSAGTGEDYFDTLALLLKKGGFYGCQSALEGDPRSARKRDPSFCEAGGAPTGPPRERSGRSGGPGRRFEDGQARFLNRQLSLPVSTISQ